MTTTTKSNDLNNGRTFGLFSLLALIIGVVMGSGIFIKNESVVDIAGSTGAAMIAWIIMAIFTMLMVFAFVEIASATKLSGKSGTMSHWLEIFVGRKTAKYIGIFMLYAYFPSIIFALGMWSGDKILMTAAPNFFAGRNNIWIHYITTIALGLLFMVIVFGINIWSNKTSKLLGNAGLVIKTLPIWVVIIMMIVAVATGTGTPIDMEVIPDATYANKSDIARILLALPPIMFSFAGFVYSASMQNEAKSPKSFMTAWVGGMAFVSIVYILFSYSIMVIGGSEYKYTLAGAITSWTNESVSSWLVPLLETMVLISIVSGFNSQTVSSAKSMAGLSAEGIMPDHRGSYVRLNSQLKPQFATYKLLLVSLAWMVILTFLDAIYIVTNANAGIMEATNFATDTVAVVSFFGYGLIMSGGVWNRFKKDPSKIVPVEKKWYFLPTAIASVISIVIIAGYQGFDIVWVAFTDKNWMKITVLILILGIPTLIMYYFDKVIEKLPKTNRRTIAVKRYYNMEIDPLFLNESGDSFQGNKYPFLMTYPSKDKLKNFK